MTLQKLKAFPTRSWKEQSAKFLPWEPPLFTARCHHYEPSWL